MKLIAHCLGIEELRCYTSCSATLCQVRIPNYIPKVQIVMYVKKLKEREDNGKRHGKPSTTLQ